MARTPLRAGLALAFAACAATPPEDTKLQQIGDELVMSPPHEWHRAVAAVLAAGPSATPALVRALEREPNGPGAEDK